MNLQHTCMQTHRIGILHTKWLGAQFKKKVESNPRIKIKVLQAKAHKKWNVTVTKSMAAKSKQEALSQIQSAFREINDYCAELLRANSGSSVSLKKEIPWIGAKESNVEMCKSLRLKNEGAFRHLNSISRRFWSRSRFSFQSKCDSLVNMR
ncbi:hypothetical protein Ahy_B05g078590 [Arachis hypogaea]|uniref:Uncharacterized protein n=1 Tax=Arachis hypogaea TaxID=3818 RepID=A0A444Z7H7_ARAHY|nr:hypothetical protein Ahy_B05g078590 [Arachis hypogaea]